MRLWPSFLSLLLVLLNPLNLFAEDPPAPWNGSSAWQPEGMTVLESSPAPTAPLRAVEPQQIETELFLGLPTELRIQWAYLRGSNVALMLEGIVGVEPLIPSVFGVFGIGGRIRWAVYNGERNAFVIKPGADVYAWAAGGGALPLGGVDVELLWWHNFGQGNRFGFELGADIGSFLFPFGVWGFFPMASGIFGFHF